MDDSTTVSTQARKSAGGSPIPSRSGLVHCALVVVILLYLCAGVNSGSAQTAHGDILSHTKQECFFPDVKDSLHVDGMFVFLNELDSLYLLTFDEQYILRASAAADSLLVFLEEVFPACPHPARVGAYDVAVNLTLRLIQCHRYENARDFGERHLSGLQTMPNRDSSTLAMQYRALGMLYAEMRDFETAGEYLSAAKVIQELRKDSSELPGTLRSLGDSRMKAGQYVEAEAAFVSCLALVRARYHPTSEAVVSAMYKLADFYHSTAQRHKAERLVQEALAALDAPARIPAPDQGRFLPAEGVTPGTEHQLWILCAMILMDSGRDADMALCLDHSFDAARRIPDPVYRYATMGLSLGTVAKWEQNLGRFEQADQHFRESLVCIDSIPNEYFATQLRAVITASRGILHAEGFAVYPLADSLMAIALPQFEKDFGTEDIQLAMPLAWWARICCRMGRTEDGLTLIRRAMRIAQDASPGPQYLARTMSILAECELLAGDVEDARKHIHEAVRNMLTVYDHRHHAALDALHIQGRCWEHAGDEREAIDAMRALIDASLARVHDAFAFEGED